MKKVQYIGVTIPNELTFEKVYDTYTVYDGKHLAINDDAGEQHLIASVHNERQAFDGDPSFVKNFRFYEEIPELVDKSIPLRVAHIPQVPGEPFYVPVENLKEAKKVSDMLAEYDQFLYREKHRGDYSNASFVEEFDLNDGEWVSWSDLQTGIDDLDVYIDFLTEVQNDENASK